MKNHIDNHPHIVATIFAAAITALMLTSLEAIARPDEARNVSSGAANAKPDALAPIKLETIVVTAKRLPVTPRAPR